MSKKKYYALFLEIVPLSDAAVRTSDGFMSNETFGKETYGWYEE